MIKSAAQMLAEIGDDEDDEDPPDAVVPHRVWRHPATRRSRLVPPGPCRNQVWGCPKIAGGKSAGHGWCGNCYAKWRVHGDALHHTVEVGRCTKANCYLRPLHDQISRTDPGRPWHTQGVKRATA